MLTMCPQSAKCGRQSRVIRTSPLTFVPKTVASSASLESSNGARPSARPALLKRMSSPPSRSTASATKRSLLSASVTSRRSAISVSSRSTRRAPPATRTPASASARAVALPIPDEAPVTIARLPARSSSCTAPTLSVPQRAQLHVLRASRDVVDLQRRVVEVEPSVEHLLDPAARGVAVGARPDEHVRRERGEAARHRPDVEVVHLDDLVVRRDRVGDRLRIDLLGRALEEDAAGVAQEAPARA